jgi:hypothetical protein
MLQSGLIKTLSMVTPVKQRTVMETPTERLKLVWSDEIGQSKVSDLYVIVFIQQQVLRLQISVHDQIEVAIFQGRHNLY